MTFTTLKYDLLRDNILKKLENLYSAKKNRYSILDSETAPDATPFIAIKATLTKLLGRVSDKVVQCKTKQTTKRKVFETLVVDLEPYAKETKDTKEAQNLMLNAIFYLLGALIHRYLRLTAVYDQYNKSPYNPLAYFNTNIWDANDSQLYSVIKDVLELDEKELDELTIVTALEVFRENMLLNVEVVETVNSVKKKVQKPRYMTHEHFATVDPNFIYYLNQMIAKYKVQGATLIKNFKALKYLQSLAIELEKENAPVERELIAWCNVLKNEHKDFNTLNPESLKLHIREYFRLKAEQEGIKNRILDVLEMSIESRKLDGVKSHDDFLELLKAFNTDESRCILCGGYVLLLKDPLDKDALDKDLYSLIKISLGLQNDFTPKDMFECIKLLEGYTGKEPAPNLNCEFFGGRVKMRGQISTRMVGFEQTIQEPSQNNTALVL